MFVVEISYLKKNSHIVGTFTNWNDANLFAKNIIEKIENNKDENSEKYPIHYYSPNDGCYVTDRNIDYHTNIPTAILIKNVFYPDVYFELI